MSCWGGRAFAIAPAGWSGTADEQSVAVALAAAAAKATAFVPWLAAPPVAAPAVPSFLARPEEASPESSVIPWDQAQGDAKSQCDLYPTRCWCSACARPSASPVA